MNRIYRLCWHRSTAQWVPASEFARSTAPGGPRRTSPANHRILILSALTLALSTTGLAWGAATGGQITAGSGNISQTGTTTTVKQNSQTLSLNWQSFNIAPNETVNFVQPGTSSIAVNRILSSSPSNILGHLDANGQVWLINPNGILFGQGAQVNVGGLVASTLDLDPSTLGSSNRSFSGSGKGSVINQGTITAANGGYVALLGNQVSNQGTVSAQLGTVALAGGSAATLTFNGNQLLHVKVDQSTLNNLVENRQLIVANGGQVLMTAGAKDAVMASLVNNTGIVQAQTVQNHNGTITLLGGMDAGTVNVGGKLDASAPNGGNGGSIETSAAHFNLANSAQISASSVSGKAGTWLVDPVDLTIDAASATTISNTLNGGTSVTEQTTATGATGIGVQTPGAGNINVNSAISWTNASANLTLLAFNSVLVNAPINGAGKVSMTASNSTINVAAAVNGAAGVTLNTAASGINIGAAVTSAGSVSMDALGGNLTLTAGGSVTGGGGVTLGTNRNFVNSAGAAAVSTGTSADWLIYSTNPTLDTAGGLTPNFIQYNAPFGTAPSDTGNGFLYSLAPTLTITGLTGAVTKVYDGTTTATLAGSNLTKTGLVNGNLISTATGAYGSPNAGSNISVTSPSSIAAFNITDATGTIPVFGYKLAGLPVTAKIGTITPAPLTASIVGDPTKTYDGTTTATLGSINYSLSGFVGTQGATVNQPSSVAYGGADAGPQTITANFASTNFIANSGTNFANYILPTTGSGPGTISPAPLLISGLLASNKVYDGTTADALNVSQAALFGVIAPDVGAVTLDTAGGIGIFASPNVGNNLAVAASGFTLTGAKANDYVLVPPTGLTANITPATLIVSGVTAQNKVYDATTADPLNLSGATLTGVVPSDAGDVSLSTAGATGAFGQSNVGNNLAVSAAGFSLSGSAAGNYTIAPVSGLSANITPAPLLISFAGNPTKIYDGSDSATLSSGDFTISGFVGTQSAVVSQSPATYASQNAGTNISVTSSLVPSDFTPANGTALSNYSFPATVSGLGTIDPAPLVATIVGNPSKVFDGTATANLTTSNYSLSGFVPGESINLASPPTTGTYASANAGVEPVSATVTAANYAAGPGTLLSNYVLPLTFSGFGTITPAPISESFNAAIGGNPTKVYDGTVLALLPAGDFILSGFQGTDSATVNQTINGAYASKNVGSQPITASLVEADFTPGAGTNLNNYTFPVNAFGTGTITPAPLLVSIINNPTKVYNGTTIANPTSANFDISGFVPGEGGTINPTTTFNYLTANAGTGINITGNLTSNNYLANGGTLLSNYTLATTASGPGTITQAPLFVTGVLASNKVYDTTTNDVLNVGAAGLAGLVSTDSSNVTLNTSTTGVFSQANVGNNLAVTANGFSISGSAASNYLLQPITGLTANISPATLTLAGITASNKIYDGTTLDSLNTSGGVLTGVLGSDTVAYSAAGASGQFSTANAGNGLSVSTSGFTISGASASNYTLAQPAGLTANITPALLTVNITGSPSKTYDGSTSATLTSADYTISGFVSGQGASLPQSATANYASPNAGTGLAVESTLVTSDYVANAGTNLANYILPSSSTGNLGVINPKILDLTGTRVYDANTDAAATLFGTGGVLDGVGSETLTLSGSGTLSTKNVGSEQPFAAGGLSGFTLTGNGTALASNYTFVGGTDWVTITPATLTVSGTIAANKVYNGNTTATLSGSTLDGVLGTDNVTLGNDATGTFATKNVGNGIAVATDMTVSGGDASNYIIVQPGNVTANITPLGIMVTATGKNKQYDGTTTAGVTLSSAGVLAGDTVTFADTSANFSQSNVGNGINILVNGISDGGASAGNYMLLNNTATTSANITPRILNLQSTRVYDANTDAAAALFGSAGVLTGVAGQTLTLSGIGTLSTKNVGTQQPFAAGGLAAFNLVGNGTALASNYTLIGGTDWVTITPAILTVSGTSAANKTYDGNTIAQLSGSMLNGVLGSDVITLGNDSTGTFATKNVGNGIAVSTNMTVSGTAISNYILQQPAGLTANITPLGITVTATGINKVYDSTTTAGVTLGSTGVVAGDNVTFADTSANFTTPNVGNGIGILVNGISDAGTDAGNYTLLNTTANTSANITPVILNLTATRVYDATTNADAALFGTNGTLTGVAGQTLSLSGVGTLSTKNVGTQQPFAAGGLGGFTLTGNGTALAGNYTLVGGTDWVTITPAQLLIDGASVVTRNYDGTSNAMITGAMLSGLLGSDAGTVLLGNDTTGTFNNKNAGDNKPVTTAMTISGADASNYTLVQPLGLTGDINPLPITVTAVGQNKVYDGTTTAGVTLGSTGVLAGDNVNFADTSANFVSANAGNGVGINVLGISDTGTDAGNYTFNTTANTAANITPVILNLTGSRVYDGTTGADASLFGTDGVLTGISGQTLTLSGTGTLSTKNVGSEQPFAGGGLAGFTLTGNGTTLASNYTFTGGTDWVTITPAVITVSAIGQNKTYDGTTTAGVTLNTSGVVAGDSLNFTDAAANFANPNAGDNIGILVTGISATGADLGNYTFNTTANTSANINPVILNLTSSRVYDGTTGADASLFGTGGVLTGISGQTLTLSGTGTLSTKNVGSEQPFAAGGLGGFTLTGNGATLAGNYTLTGGTDWVTITPLAITVDATGQNKTYDGTTTAGVTLSSGGILPGDTVNFGDGSANFSSPNAGTNISILVNGITGSGTDAGNYTFNNTATTSANIDPAVLNLTGTRVYDSTTNATASLFGSNGVLTGVNGETLTLSGIGTLSTENVGSELPFAAGGLGGFTLSGNGAAMASNYTFIGGTDWVTITPAILDVTGTTTTNRVYDGTTIDMLSGSTLSGLFAGDSVALGNDTTGTFNNKNVGNNKPITTAMTIDGADAGNYILIQPTGLTANVTPLGIMVDATGNNKVYDGNTLDTVGLSSTGVLAGDQVNFASTSANFSDKNVGSGKTVTVDGLSDSGADAGNYILLNTTATTIANITPLMIMVNAKGTNKIYDGNAVDTVSLSSAGILPGDQLSFSDALALFNNKNVGNGKLVSVSGITGSGADAGNYVFNTSTTTEANVTPLPIKVIAIGINKIFNGNSNANVTLLGNGVLPGDQLGFRFGSAQFSSPSVGDGKTVTVTGISGTGEDAGNYLVIDPTVTTIADITGMGALGTGVQDSWIAQIQSVLSDSRPIATPYGLADANVVGVYTGNQKLKHRPIERNRIRSDFHSGLGLKVVGGGVRLPTDASP